MNRNVNLVENLLVKGRKLHKLGLHTEALEIFNRLSTFRSLPGSVARETHLHLAHLHRTLRQYRQARRHLAAAMTHDPLDPRHHHRMGRLAEADLQCDPRRALRHYRQALLLDPRNPRYLSAYGLFALRNDRPRVALAALRRAYRLSPDHPVVLKRYLKVLRRLRRLQEARQVLRTCRFRLGNAEWFVRLEQNFQFFALRLQQHQQARQAREAGDERLTVLPFLATRPESDPAGDFEFLRTDGPTVLPTPHLPLRKRRRGERYAL